MALRNIRINDDPILRKKCKAVTEVTDKFVKIVAV